MAEVRNVAPGEFYRHFKDKLYQVKGIAYHSETKEKMVVYQALYGEYKWYVRPYDMFVSEVDHVKYPDVKQKYRFEKVNLDNAEKTNKELNKEAIIDDATDVIEAEDGVINPLLLQFLDAKSYREKLNILAAIHMKMDERLLSDIAISLDEVLPEGTLEEQFMSIKNCVMTHAKYEESNRLR